MVPESDRLTDLLLGKERGKTRRAVILVVGFVIGGGVVEYLLLRTEFENEVIATVHTAFVLDGYLPTWYATGALVVVGLAVVQAYLNEGYLPSVLLGWSLVYGNVVWTIESRTTVGTYSLDPVAAFERTFPEAVVLATLGFLVGLVLRRMRRRGRTRVLSRSGSQSSG